MRQLLPTITLLLVLICGPLAAQSPIVRLGADDRTVSVLEQQLRIESAATIGRTALAVWGASVNDEAEDLRPLLRMQLLDGVTPVGEQRTLHGEAARPYGVVRVLPVSGAFLVLWNDNRSTDPGIYGRRVALDGTFLGDEVKLADGYIYRGVSWDVRPLGDPARGQGLVYANPMLGGASVLRIDAAGNLTGSSGPHGAVQFQMFSYGELGGLSLMTSPGGGSRIIHPDGRVDTRTPRIPTNARAYYIGADSSLATIEQGELRLRRNLFDSLPATSAHIGALDSLTGTAVALARTDAGDYDIYFAVAATSKSGAPQISRLRVTIYRVRYTAAGVVQAPVAVVSREKMSPADAMTWDATVASAIVGQSNTRLFDITFRTLLHSGTDSVQLHNTTFEFSLDVNGALKLDRSYGLASVTEENGPSGFLSTAAPAQPIARRSSSGESIVRVTVPEGTIDLTSSIAARSAPFPRMRPTIRLVDGELITTAELDGARYEVSRWKGDASPATLIQTRAADTIPAFAVNTDQGERILTTSSAATIVVDSVGGPTMVMESAARDDNLRLLTAPDTYTNIDSVRTRVRVDLATPQGWKRVMELDTRGVPPNDKYYWTDDAGWNPNRNEKVVIAGVWPDLTAIMSAFDTDGNPTWTTPCMVSSLPTVPLDRNEYLVMGDEQAVRYNGTDSIAAFPVSIPTGNVSYRRLLGPSFLRINESVSGARLTIEHFDLSVNLLNSAELEFNGPAESYLFQDERDSTLILLHNVNGLRMTRLNREMQVFVQDSLLVPQIETGMWHPEGVVRNDTLFYVWSDRRSGQWDVYASWIKLGKYVPGTSAVAGSAAAGTSSVMSIASLSPNPARDRVELVWTLPARGSVRLDVVDNLGRSVMTRELGTMEAGSHRVSVATGDLRSGSYLVRLRSGGLHADAPMVVVR